jgi:hypothetical protein
MVEQEKAGAVVGLIALMASLDRASLRQVVPVTISSAMQAAGTAGRAA